MLLPLPASFTKFCISVDVVEISLMKNKRAFDTKVGESKCNLFENDQNVEVYEKVEE